MEVFYSPPRCPFVELGVLEARSRFGSLEAMVFAMRETAGRNGADAIVLVDHRHRYVRWAGGLLYSAIAVARSSYCTSPSTIK